RRDRTSAARRDALLLLALLLALRCMLDPWDISYYWLPFLLAVLGWEVVGGEHPPVVAVVATLAVAFTLQNSLAFDTQAALFLAVGLPALAVLIARVYAPGVAWRLCAAAK